MFYDKKTGRSYTSTNFSQEYIPKAHRNPRSVIHAEMYEASRKKSAAERKKESEKEAKQSKKKWIESGCGHQNLKELFRFGVGEKDPDSHLSSVPVSDEKKSNMEGSVLDEKKSHMEDPGLSESATEDSSKSGSDSGSVDVESAEYRLNQIVSLYPSSPMEQTTLLGQKSPMSSCSSEHSVKVTKVVPGTSKTIVERVTLSVTCNLETPNVKTKKESSEHKEEAVDKEVDDDPLGLGPSPEFVCVCLVGTRKMTATNMYMDHGWCSRL